MLPVKNHVAPLFLSTHSPIASTTHSAHGRPIRIESKDPICVPLKQSDTLAFLGAFSQNTEKTHVVGNWAVLRRPGEWSDLRLYTESCNLEFFGIAVETGDSRTG